MNKLWHYITETKPWLGVVVCTSVFLGILLATALYADRQIIDYHTDLHNASQKKSRLIDPARAFVRYDTNHYINIANDGYTATDTKNNTAFFPTYPILVHLTAQSGVSVAAATQIVSVFFTFLSAVIVFYWLRFELSRLKSGVSPWQVLLMIALFPTSLYLTVGYSESVFIFFTTASLFAYRTKHYYLAAIAIALATATRVQGGALAFFFLLDYLTAKRWHDWKKLIPVVAAPIGLVAFMVYLYVQFGNAFEFIEAQKNWGRLNDNIVHNLISSFRPPYLWYLPVLGAMLYATKRFLGSVWFVYALVFILIPLISGRLDSLNRYMLALPPLFLALSLWLETKPRWIQQTYWLTSAMLLIWNVLFFFNDYWVG